MKVAEHPERKCREPIQNGFATYWCEVKEWHAGPHATLSDPESVRRRDEWEAAQPGWEKLSEFDDPFKKIVP